MSLEMAVKAQPTTETVNLSSVAGGAAIGNTIVRVRDLRKVFPRKKANPRTSFWSRFLPQVRLVCTSRQAGVWVVPAPWAEELRTYKRW